MSLGNRIVGAITLASSLASLVVIAASKSFREWVYPEPLIIALVLALMASWGYFLLFLRRPSSADQARLNQLFTVLPRAAVTRIRNEDFSLAWRDDLLYPVDYFLHECNSIEHQFDAPPLEKRRKHLRDAGEHFAHTEAYKAVMFQPGRRYIGKTSGELEAETAEVQERAEKDRAAIHDAAADFSDAHDALVREAKRRRFDLAALESEPLKAPW